MWHIIWFHELSTTSVLLSGCNIIVPICQKCIYSISHLFSWNNFLNVLPCPLSTIFLEVVFFLVAAQVCTVRVTHTYSVVLDPTKFQNTEAMETFALAGKELAGNVGLFEEFSKCPKNEQFIFLIMHCGY